MPLPESITEASAPPCRHVSGADFPVSEENVCKADKRGAARQSVGVSNSELGGVVLSFRLLLRKIHLPRQRKAFGCCLSKRKTRPENPGVSMF